MPRATLGTQHALIYQTDMDPPTVEFLQSNVKKVHLTDDRSSVRGRYDKERVSTGKVT